MSSGGPCRVCREFLVHTREDVAEALIALGFPTRESYDAVDEICRRTGPADSQVLLKGSLILLKERKKI